MAQLFIEPSWQGAGLGCLLLAAAETAMRRGGVEEAYLTCAVGNERARAFYLRHGWSEQGVESYPAQVEDDTTPVSVWCLAKRLLNPDR